MWLVGRLLIAALDRYAANAESPVADAAAKRPIPLMFDTDIGNDIDDALALGMIHALDEPRRMRACWPSRSRRTSRCRRRSSM